MIAKWLLVVQASHPRYRQEEERNANDTRVCSSPCFLFYLGRNACTKILLMYHPGLDHVATSRVLGTLQHGFPGSIKEEGCGGGGGLFPQE